MLMFATTDLKSFRYMFIVRILFMYYMLIMLKMY